MKVELRIQEKGGEIEWTAGLVAERVVLLYPFHRLFPVCPMESRLACAVFI
jgi:hypothetical protein